jgi:hypothetical protein
MDRLARVPRATLLTLSLLLCSACAEPEVGAVAETAQDTVASPAPAISDSPVSAPASSAGTESPVSSAGAESATSSAAQPAAEQQSTEVSPGYTLIRGSLPEEPGSRLVYVKMSGSAVRPEVLGVTKEHPAGRSGQSVATGRTAVVLGSAFVTSFYPPTPAGLLIVAGETTGKLFQAGLSTIVFVRGDTIGFAARDAAADMTGMKGALQLGPRLIENGVVAILDTEPRDRKPSTRAFIAKCAGATTIAGITESPVSLYHLARYLGAAKSAGGPGCTEAVNLSGDGSELLIVRSADGTIAYAGGNTTVRQAGLIAFVR